MTHGKFGVFMPFHAAEKGDETLPLPERLEVHEHDLRLLTRQLQTMSTQRVLALFGQRQPVVASVQQVLEEKIDADKLHKDNCIYVAVKGEWLLIIAIVDSQFFEKRVIDKESIVVTLFRYLEDFSPTVVLCVDDDTIENFVVTSNPFTYVLHSAKVYKLETQKHVKVQASQLATNCADLLRKDFHAHTLVLNDNASRFFLQQKLDTLVQEELLTKTKNCSALVKLLVKHFEQKPADVNEMVRNLDLHLSDDHLRRVAVAHEQYARQVTEHMKSLATLFSTVCKDTFDKMRKNKRLNETVELWVKSGKEKEGVSKIEASAELAANELIESMVRQNLTQETDAICYKQFVDRITDLFEDLKKKMQYDEITEIVKRCLPMAKFSATLKSQEVRIWMENAESLLNSILTDSLQLHKSQSLLRINVHAINTQRDADGTCTALTVVPHLRQVNFQSDQLQDYFQTGKQDSSSSKVDEMMRNVTVKAMFPLKSDRSFLLLFDNGSQCQVLMVLSIKGSHSLISRMKIKEAYFILPYLQATYDNHSSRFVLIISSENPRFVLFEVTESFKYVALSEAHSSCAIKGKIASAASFVEREKLLLFTDRNSLYEVDLSSRNGSGEFLMKEVFRRENRGDTVVRSKLKTNGGNYTHVQSILNENFFLLRNDTVLDVFDWNFTRQLSINILTGSIVKAFSDNQNVYLFVIATNQKEVTCYSLAELGADVTLQHQNETPVQQVDGNPIVDVIYASYLKYGANSQFIGAPAQNQYVVALRSKNDNFDLKLQSYVKTFAKTIKVACATLADICQQCEAQPANRHLPAIFSSRTPVQICTVEANNLLPLVDGKRKHVAPERVTSIAEAAESMSFAHLDRVINEFCDDRSVRVVSIIGRQSSGKSYLLNQLFGTRFSVAATRCTDGIWMSYARIVTDNDDDDSQSFVVLDCEGLFSIYRNEQEEVKLLLILAAVSDVTILNQDLNFNRYINQLFTNLNNAIGKVTGSNYFHGILMVAVRDVPSSESTKTAQEFERNIKTINRRSEHQFLMRLFSSTMILHCLNYFETPMFAFELKAIQKSLLTTDTSKRAGADVTRCKLLESLKVVLQQVYNDDEQSADEHLKQIEQNRIDNLVTVAWAEIGNVGTKADEVFKFSVTTGKPASGDDSLIVEIAQKDVQFEYCAENSDAHFDVFKQALETRFFRSINRFAKPGFNQRWTAFNAFFEDFVRHRAQLLEQYALELVQKLGSLMNEADAHNFLVSLKAKIQSFSANCGVCLGKCQLCHLTCLRRKGHRATLELQKQQLEDQLNNIMQTLSIYTPTTKEDMVRLRAATEAKLQEMRRKLSHVESQLKAQQIAAQLVQLDAIVSEKQSTLNSKRSQLSCSSQVQVEVDCCSITLQDFLAASSKTLQLALDDSDSLLRTVLQAAPHSETNADERSVQNLQTSTHEKQADRDVVNSSVLVQYTRPIEALRDGVQKLLRLVASPADAIGKLSQLCADLPGLAPHASEIAALAQERARTATQRLAIVNNLPDEIQDCNARSVVLEEECDDLKRSLATLDDELRKTVLANEHGAAKRDEIQRFLQAKQTKLQLAQHKLSEWTASFQSLPQLEQDYSDTISKIKGCAAVVDELKKRNTLLLSSVEEARQVAEMMQQYFKLSNDKLRSVNSHDSSDSPEWEVVSGDEASELCDQSTFASEECGETKFPELQAKKLEQDEETMTKKLKEQENQMTSPANSEPSLQTAGLVDALNAVQEKEKVIKVETNQLLEQPAIVEKDKQANAGSESYCNQQRKQQLYESLTKNYAPHFNNTDVRKHSLEAIRLCRVIEALKKQASDDAEVKKVEAELQSCEAALHDLMWDRDLYNQLQKGNAELSLLEKHRTFIELVLLEWRSFGEIYKELRSDVDQLTGQVKVQADALVALQKSLETLEKNYKNAEVELKEKQKTYDALREKINRDQFALADELPKLKMIVDNMQKQTDCATCLHETITKLLGQTEQRRIFEEAELLEEEIASLTQTRTAAQSEKTLLDNVSDAAALELQDYESLKAAIKEQSKSVALQSAYLKLISDLQELLTNNVMTCSCGLSSHECEQQCSICPEDNKQLCKHKAGHDDPELLLRGLAGPKEHCCSKPKHDCPAKCHLCDSPCVQPAKHSNPERHLCASSHQCESRCKYCTDRCKGNLAEAHSAHVCASEKCPQRCILCGNACAGSHEHEDTAPLVDVDRCFGERLPTWLKNKLTDVHGNAQSELKLHLCAEAHPCPKLCEKPGVCKIDYQLETRQWTQTDCSQEYEYIKPIKKNRPCLVQIAPGDAWHQDAHDCSKQHSCCSTCPECAGFCKLPFDHAGLHKTSMHRNMEHCYCVTRSKDAAAQVQLQDVQGGKKARVYQAGNVLTPEICTQHCNRKGRAHYHLKPCLGGSSCGEKIHSNGVLHCDERFIPHKYKAYDKYLCATFWESVNWQPPYNNAELQLCNFFCPHSQHNDERDKINFCTGTAWHSHSPFAAYHTFQCGHDFQKRYFNGLDVCFCIDTTASMATYIKQSAQSIKMMMQDVVPQLKAYEKDTSCLRFAVVGYKDHSNDKVVNHVDFCSATEAISFLDSLKATGGRDFPEAVLDGLDCASNLKWRDDCEKLLFHIGDAPPHGRQFTSLEDEYPDGCPCKLDEVTVLKRLKQKSVKYHVIPLNSSMNLMIQVFQKHITVIREDLTAGIDLTQLIPMIACRAIEDSELTATDS